MAGGSNPVPKFRRVEPLLAPEALCDSHRGSRATAASAPAVVDAYASANPNVGHERIADAHKRERASGAWDDRIHADTAADCTIGMATRRSRASAIPDDRNATRPSENAERAGFGSAVRARRVTSGVTLPCR